MQVVYEPLTFTKRDNAMLKQSTAVAILLLTLPASASARDNSLNDFLNGSANSLSGVDSQPGPDQRARLGTITRTASGTSVGGAKANPNLPDVLWSFGKEKDCDGRSVKDFMNGKCNKLYGIDSTHSRDLLFRKGPSSKIWGADEFVDTEGFTQSGAPYQQHPSVQSIKQNLERRVIERLNGSPKQFEENHRSIPVDEGEGTIFNSPNRQYVPFEPKRK